MVRKSVAHIQRYKHSEDMPTLPKRTYANLRYHSESVYGYRGWPLYSIYERIDGGDFLEQAIRYSLFSVATTITERYPGIWLKDSGWSTLRLWRSEVRCAIKNTSREGTMRVLSGGSYDQCKFVMEQLLSLRSCGSERKARKGSSCYPEDGVSQWSRCPLSKLEYANLLRGNVRMYRPERQRLWDVIEEQVKLGHSRSTGALRTAILCGNTNAVEEMIRRGWAVNGPIWMRFMTPLQYSQGLTKLNGRFKELFRHLHPDLPQSGWIGSSSHAAVYKAYQAQVDGHSWTDWSCRLETCQEILRSHGGKTSALTTIFQKGNHTLLLWSLILVILLYTAVLPLALVYGTTGIWTAMDVGQKLGFAYLWSLLCFVFPPIFAPWTGDFTPKMNLKWWAPVVSMFILNYIVLPVLIIRVNWQPFISCKVVPSSPVHSSTSSTDCQSSISCTNYSFLLPFAFAGIEGVSWIVYEIITDR
jgi:hypothetical protein